MLDLSRVNQIDAAAQEAENAIHDLQIELQAEGRLIRRQAFDAGRPLSAAEKVRLQEIGTAMRDLNNALIELSFVTVQQIDNSETVVVLKDRVNQINQNLSGSLDKLRKLEKFAATAARVADVLAQVAQGLAAVAVAVA